MGTDQTISSLIFLIISQKWQVEDLVTDFEGNTETVDQFMATIKYKRLLPHDLQIRYICYNFLDLKSTISYLNNITKDI
ncbi:MAG TPA: hypothetical protein DIW15_02185 [Bavariicoccus seileri]|uniref:Uncharacterized protein n=1 Tax=Bavariicoccus seileri TaxID=549685 RepID=A0A3D4S6B2_9ENTE|nr:hypothetical protein [Bavariicoccus seileri]HCS93501.1 hypothetical protein [Bavariicoccus seileri]